MKDKKMPPSVCKTENGGGNPNMITRTESYHPARVLSNGGFCDG